MAPKVAKAEPKHPKYIVMIADAIKTLKERTGSSTPAIAKVRPDRTRPQHRASPLDLLDRCLSLLRASQVIKSKYDVPETFQKTLAQQLKAMAAKGKLVRVKASFKLSEELKKPAAKKPAAKKPVAAKKAKVTTHICHRPRARLRATTPPVLVIHCKECSARV